MNTNLTLDQRLKKYLLAAGSITGAAVVAQGQVIYTDINPDVVLDATGETYTLDFNNDASGEILFYMYNGIISSSVAAYGLYVTSASNSMSVLGAYLSYNWNGSSTTIGVPTALEANVSVDVNNNFITYGFPGLEAFYLSNPGDVLNITEWLGKNDKFLGVVFAAANSDYHFGWVRCSMSADGKIFTIKDYAYESIPNVGIVTGSTVSVGLEEVSKAPISIVQRGAKVLIQLQDNSNGGTVQVFNTAGQLVYEEAISGNQSRMDLSDKQGGVYSIHVQNGSSSFSKKIILF